MDAHPLFRVKKETATAATIAEIAHMTLDIVRRMDQTFLVRLSQDVERLVCGDLPGHALCDHVSPHTAKMEAVLKGVMTSLSHRALHLPARAVGHRAE